MKIQIATGIGKGLTTKSAFDNALADAGIADYNIIPLSSVIPPNTTIEKVDKIEVDGEYGDALFVVMADTVIREGELSAGIGWVQEKGDNRGLFVEFVAEKSEELLNMVTNGLKEMTNRRGKEYNEINSVIISANNDNEGYTCGLVVAAYKTRGWGL